MTTSKSKPQPPDAVEATETPEVVEEPQPVSENEGVAAISDQVPASPPPVERDPDEWTEPSWDKGMFPGDPNTYPDPENPMRSP